MVEVLERAKQKAQQTREQASAAYNSMIVALTSDAYQGSADDIETVAQAAGKTLADVDNAVTIRRRRDALRETINEATAATARRAELETEITAANVILQTAQRQHAATVAPLSAEMNSLTQLIVNEAQARAELTRTADPEFLARQTALRHKTNAAENTLSQARSKLHDIGANYSAAKSRPFVDQKEVAEYQRQTEAVQRMVADATVQRDALVVAGEKLYQEILES